MNKNLKAIDNDSENKLWMKMTVLVKLNEHERIDENKLRKIQSLDENELWIYNSWRWIMKDRWNELKGVTGLK